jgi:hypothetical protein
LGPAENDPPVEHPDAVNDAAPPWQIVTGVGAVGACPIEIDIASLAEPQGPAGSFVVSVSVTNPAVISAALGVYVAFNVALFGLNVPAPPDHVAEEAPPPILPLSVIGLPEQTD